MGKLRAFWLRLFGGRSARAEFDAELQSHIEMDIANGVRAGLSREEARRQALIRLGGAEQTRQAWRDRSSLPWLESARRDVVYALRSLRKRQGVTWAAILSLALGVGANTTIFSIVSRFVLQSPPVGDPGTLLSIAGTHVGDRCCNNLPWPVYTDLRSDAKSFSDMAAYFDLIPASLGGQRRTRTRVGPGCDDQLLRCDANSPNPWAGVCAE